MHEGAAQRVRDVLLRYGAGGLAAGIAVIARLALDPVFGMELPYITFFASALFAAWVGGLGPGLLAVTLCAVAADWEWLPPLHSLAIADPRQAIGLVLFIAIASVMVLLINMERTASARTKELAALALLSDQRTRAVLESVGDCFYSLDRDFRFTYLNHQAAEYFGRPRETLLGRSIWEAMPEKRGTIFEQSFREVNALGRAARFETLSPVTRRWVDVHAYPADGGGILVFLRDLSERRALALGEERMKAILNSASDAIITIDEDERITVFSAGAEQIFRCQAADAIGTPIERFIPERYRATHHEFIRGFAATGVSTRQMGGERLLVARRANGEEFPMEARISQSRVGGEQLYTVILRDVTWRTQVEREREHLLAQARAAAADAERANRAKDDFLATVSHELRTPLMPILSWARMLQTREPADEVVARGAASIERAAKSQAQLIEDLLDISRIVSGKLRLDVRRIDPTIAIEGAIESLRPAADAKGIDIRAVLDPRSGLVSGDQERLQQVVWNLLSNAIKFTPKGGRVTVVLGRVDSHVEIVVSDTGQGIAPAFRPYIFDRFRQADTTMTRTLGGLGLGLAIVRHLVELHGGTVTCESRGAGQGTVFTVSLPLAPFQTVSPADAHPRVGEPSDLASHPIRPVLQGLRILVVDDERDTVEAIAVVLGDAGADVRTAPSARVAYDVVRAWRPDILVSDLGMPEEDGYSLIRKVRALSAEEGGRVPALALTAFARVEDRMKVLNAGFQMHVPKPIEPAELVAVVSSVSTIGIVDGRHS